LFLNNNHQFNLSLIHRKRHDFINRRAASQNSITKTVDSQGVPGTSRQVFYRVPLNLRGIGSDAVLFLFNLLEVLFENAFLFF